MFLFIILGVPARLRRHLCREAVETFHETSLPPDQVPDRRRAVGLSAAMSGRHRTRHSLVSPPLGGPGGIPKPANSRPFPLPSLTHARPTPSTRFAANHPIPSPDSFHRAANPAHGTSNDGGIRIRHPATELSALSGCIRELAEQGNRPDQQMHHSVWPPSPTENNTHCRHTHYHNEKGRLWQAKWNLRPARAGSKRKRGNPQGQNETNFDIFRQNHAKYLLYFNYQLLIIFLIIFNNKLIHR